MQPGGLPSIYNVGEGFHALPLAGTARTAQIWGLTLDRVLEARPYE